MPTPTKDAASGCVSHEDDAAAVPKRALTRLPHRRHAHPACSSCLGGVLQRRAQAALRGSRQTVLGISRQAASSVGHDADVRDLGSDMVV